MLENLKQKLMDFIGLSDFEDNDKKEDVLVDMKQLQSENRKLKAMLKEQDKILQDLSEDNIKLGRQCRQLTDKALAQERLLDVYRLQAM